jgi:hypothetical protein
MAQFSNNLTERFDKQKAPAGLPWRLFIFSLMLFSFTVLGYFGLRFGYSTYLETQLRLVEGRISDLARQIPKEQQDAYLGFYSQTVNLQTLLSKHILASKIFPLLEANTNQGVFYARFDLNVAEKKLSVDGFARSYEILAQQLEAYRRLASLENSTVSESKLADGRVSFRATLNLKPEIFKLTAQ